MATLQPALIYIVFTNWADCLFRYVGLLIVWLVYKFLFINFVPRPWRTKNVFLFTVSLVIVAYAFLVLPEVDAISTQVYVGQKFGVTPNWQQSLELRNLFSYKYFSPGAKWYPCDDVKNLPVSERLPALMEKARLVEIKDNHPLELEDKFAAMGFPSLIKTQDSLATSSGRDASAPSSDMPSPRDNPPSNSVTSNSSPSASVPATAYQGTSSTNFAKDWIVVDGTRIDGITSVNPAPAGQVAILYSDGGRNVPADEVPQGFLDAWKITPEKLQEADR